MKFKLYQVNPKHFFYIYNIFRDMKFNKSFFRKSHLNLIKYLIIAFIYISNSYFFFFFLFLIFGGKKDYIK